MSPAAPRLGARQVHSEDRVTAWDFTWSAAQTPVTVRYERDTVLVWLTSGTFRLRADQGEATGVTVVPGSVWYRERGRVETEELTGGSPRAIIFEFR